MSVPSKIHNIPLVKIRPEERLAATSELNLASSLDEVVEVRTMSYKRFYVSTDNRVAFNNTIDGNT